MARERSQIGKKCHLVLLAKLFQHMPCKQQMCSVQISLSTFYADFSQLNSKVRQSVYSLFHVLAQCCTVWLVSPGGECFKNIKWFH